MKLHETFNFLIQQLTNEKLFFLCIFGDFVVGTFANHVTIDGENEEVKLKSI